MIKKLEEKEFVIKNNIKKEIELLSLKFKKISTLFSKLSQFFITQNLDNNNDNNNETIIKLDDNKSNNTSIIEILSSDSSKNYIKKNDRTKIKKEIIKFKKKKLKKL